MYMCSIHNYMYLDLNSLSFCGKFILQNMLFLLLDFKKLKDMWKIGLAN